MNKDLIIEKFFLTSTEYNIIYNDVVYNHLEKITPSLLKAIKEKNEEGLLYLNTKELQELTELSYSSIFDKREFYIALKDNLLLYFTVTLKRIIESEMKK